MKETANDHHEFTWSISSFSLSTEIINVRVDGDISAPVLTDDYLRPNC